MRRDALIGFAALSAAIAIAAGAFGAHAARAGTIELLRTGALYQMVHAVAAIALVKYVRPAWLMLGSVTLFAFSLYALALGAPRVVGAVTPLGGAGMILAWLWIAFGRAR